MRRNTFSLLMCLAIFIFIFSTPTVASAQPDDQLENKHMGWYQVNGDWYYANSDGIAEMNQWIGNYYVGENGIMMTNTWIGPYYVGSDGAWIPDYGQPKWVKSGSRWWYNYGDGSYPKNEWKMIGGTWYHFDQSGWMQTGWYQADGTWYYSYSSGAMASNTWIGNYYLTSSGAMAVNTWIGPYYVGSDGAWIPSKTIAQNLKVGQQTDQIIFVETSGTYAVIRMEEKDQNGNWSEVLHTNGRIGSGGLGKQIEGDRKTPIGVFDLGIAFGIKPDPGCPQGYTQVDNTHYWVGDSSSPYYNQFISTRNVPLSTDTKKLSEHIIDYGKVYNYCIDIGYNRSCTPHKGSAIFLHCSGTSTTAGCISIPEDKLIQILQRLHKNAKIAIGTTQDIRTF